MSARPRLAAAATALAAVAVHGRSVWSGFTGLDDTDLVVDDRAFLARPGSVWAALRRPYMHVVDPSHGYHRPLVTASYALDARWSGVSPAGYHLTNVALHAAASVLFLVLLRRLALGPRLEVAGALAFAVTPAIASAVAWIPGRNDSLLAVFALGAWLLFLRDAAAPSWGARLSHLASLALALLTKETAVAIPFVCVAHLALVRPGEWTALRRSTRAAAYVAGWSAALAGFVALHGRVGLPGGGVLGGARVLAASLGKVVFPFDPAAIASSEDVAAWPGWLALAGIAAAAALVPGVRRRVVALGGAVFILFLAPALALGGTLVLDCRLYLPACGAIVAILEIARAAAARDGAGDGRLAAAVSGVALVAMAAVTVAFEGAFHDPRAFARQAVADSPRSPLAHLCLGRSLQSDGDLDRALGEYRAALALGPAEVAHNNIGVIFMARARWADAERELRDEIALNPGYARAYANLAITLRHEGRLDEARAARARAAELARGPE